MSRYLTRVLIFMKIDRKTKVKKCYQLNLIKTRAIGRLNFIFQ